MLATVGAQAERMPRLVLAGPPAAVSFPLIHMVASGALAEVADEVSFVSWRDPDQLRVMALDGRADVLALPTNVGANLYNRGIPLRMLNVSTWGILWLVSRNADIRQLSDLKGEEIAMPFRADMPDIVFGVVAERQGLDARRDFRLRYVATPMDAVQLLIARRVDHALLAEPAVSMALRKTRSFPVNIVAPELHRAVDLQAEWGSVFGRPARMPQAGIALLGAAAANDALARKVAAAYRDSLAWCQAQAEACGQLVADHIDLLEAAAVADAIAASPLEAVAISDATEALTHFFEVLHARNPALVGGRMPDAGFYGQRP
ncbi:MAG: ABC transporter substrate-binding protein [Rhodocyclaceae bacterium]